jgi:hypothetical protein
MSTFTSTMLAPRPQQRALTGARAIARRPSQPPSCLMFEAEAKARKVAGGIAAGRGRGKVVERVPEPIRSRDTLYGPLVEMGPEMRNARFIEACMMVCRVKDFDGKRLLANAKRCRDKFASYSTKEAYLDMLEAVYNFGRAAKVVQ